MSMHKAVMTSTAIASIVSFVVGYSAQLLIGECPEPCQNLPPASHVIPTCDAFSQVLPALHSLSSTSSEVNAFTFNPRAQAWFPQNMPAARLAQPICLFNLLHDFADAAEPSRDGSDAHRPSRASVTLGTTLAQAVTKNKATILEL